MIRVLKIILPIVILLLGAGALALLISHRKPVDRRPVERLPILIETVKVDRQAYQFSVSSEGTVEPVSDILLSTELEGRVEFIAPFLEDGGFFDKGEVLLRIDARDYELAVVQAQALVTQAQARLLMEETEADVSRREWQSMGQGKKPSPLVLREPQLAAAKANVESAIAALEKANLDLEKTQVRAPFNGRVWEKRVGIGQFVRRGDAVARLYAIDFAEVRLPLPLEKLALLDLPLDVRDDGLVGNDPPVGLSASFGGKPHQWVGRIVRTEGEIDRRSRMITLVARVMDPYGTKSSGTQAPLAVGLFVQAKIEGRRVSDVYVVPRAALRSGAQVWVVDKENRLRDRAVEVLWTGRELAVLRSPVALDQPICVSALNTPVMGMKVAITNGERTTPQASQRAGGIE